MPYIKQEQRKELNPHLEPMLDRWYHMPKNDVAGEFTYVIYRLLKIFGGKFWMRALGMGCMVCAMLEMYRQYHAPYENEKIEENGDV